jgi:hypothetical protein
MLSFLATFANTFRSQYFVITDYYCLFCTQNNLIFVNTAQPMKKHILQLA